MKNASKRYIQARPVLAKKTVLATVLISLMSLPFAVWSAAIPEYVFDLSDSDQLYFPNNGGKVEKGLIGEDTREKESPVQDVFNAVYWLDVYDAVPEIYKERKDFPGNYGGAKDAHLIFNGALDLEYIVVESPENYSTAFNFFEPAALDSTHYLGLHEFEFKDEISVVIRHADIHVASMSADGKDNPGLLVTNKKRVVTFDEKANLRVGYQVHFSASDNDDALFVLAGIYTGFGAAKEISSLGEIFNLPKDISKLTADEAREMLENSKASRMGVTTFEKGLNLTVVNSQASVETSPKNQAAYGIFVNEGGAVNIRGGQSNIVLIGSEGSTAISAVNVSARAGILDVMKQGKVNLTASEGMSRLWSFSSDIIDGAPLSPMPGQTAEDAGKHNLMMRDAVQAFHGAQVVIEDEAGKGSLDIRGDILAGIKNESQRLFVEGDLFNSHVGNFNGAVNNASAAIKLSNTDSTLFGNIYERHRISDDEIGSFRSEADVNKDNQTFLGWVDWMKKEQAREGTLGGAVRLTLENGAAWYPILGGRETEEEAENSGWKGWDYTAVTSWEDMDRYNEVVNRSDQYNLKWTDKEGAEHVANHASEDSGIVNDADLVQTADEADIAYVDRSDVEELNGAEVDNGIYQLTLNDGVVDSRFMRIDFNKKIYVKEFADIDDALISTPDEGKEGGIRKLRIQELSGKGGIFRIYAKDKANHDVVVIDNSSEKTVNSFEIWNSIEDQTLGIDARDPTTFVHIARAGRNVGFGDSILKKTAGSVWATLYNVRADEENAWTRAQNAELDVSQGTTPDGVIWEHDREQNWFITDWKRTGNPTYEDTAVSAFSIPYLYATQMERLQKRMGEARYSLGEEDGAWVRLHHGRADRSRFEDKNTMVQIGWDRRSHHDGAAAIHGVAFDYLHSDADYADPLYGQAEMDRYRLSLYTTWFGSSGWYVDGVGRLAWHDTDMKGMNRDGDAFDTGFSMWAAAASIEAGWKLSSADKWYAEPQAQLQYTRIGSSDYKTSNEVRIDNSSVDSLIGRVGLRLGRDLERMGEQKVNFYLRADILHEFMGEQTFRMQGHHDMTALNYEFTGDNTWYDVGLGITYRAGDNYSFFVDAERPFGDDIGNSWELNAGFRWLF